MEGGEWSTREVQKTQRRCSGSVSFISLFMSSAWCLVIGKKWMNQSANSFLLFLFFCTLFVCQIPSVVFTDLGTVRDANTDVCSWSQALSGRNLWKPGGELNIEERRRWGRGGRSPSWITGPKNKAFEGMYQVKAGRGVLAEEIVRAEAWRGAIRPNAGVVGGWMLWAWLKRWFMGKQCSSGCRGAEGGERGGRCGGLAPDQK